MLTESEKAAYYNAIWNIHRLCEIATDRRAGVIRMNDKVYMETYMHILSIMGAAVRNELLAREAE